MPAQTTLSADEKAKIKQAVPPSSFKIQTAATARIYYAHPDTSSWGYSGLQGAVALAQDKSRGVFMFKMVDITGTRGVIWEHELYEGFEYYEDRPFFHTFEGDVSRPFTVYEFCRDGHAICIEVASCCLVCTA